MNLQKNMLSKKMQSMIAVFLILSLAIPMMTISTATAHTPAWQIKSYAYVSAAPNPVGVGQTVYVYMWVDLPFTGALVTNDIRRHGYTLTTTLPDGTTTTQTWAVVQDTTGVQSYSFTPTTVGNYTLTFDYPGQVHTWNDVNYQNDTYLPAQAVVRLSVQQDAVPPVLQSAALPTEYWNRPINGANSDWFSIASNWLNGPYIRSGATSTGGAGYGRYQKDGSGPETSHVMWTKPIQYGGVVGGTSYENEGEGYYTGSSYNPRYANAIIMQGTLFYQEPYGNGGGGGDEVAVDLQTGKELWRVNCSATGVSLVPTFGYLYAFEDPNQHGILPNGLLIATTTVTGLGTVWRGYDPRTGALTAMNMTNVPSGSAAAATLAANMATGASAAGPHGEYLIYSLYNYGTTAAPKYYLTEWNSSKMTDITPGQIGASNWYPTTFNASDYRMYDWNVSLSSVAGQGWAIFRDTVFNDRLLLVQGNLGPGPRTLGTGANITAVSLNPATKGNILWSKYYAPADNNVTRVLVAVDSIAGTFVTEDKETLELNGFDLNNGNHIWTSEPVVCAWDTLRRDTCSAYGNLYAAGYDGICYCYDDKTGNLLWTYGNGGEGNSTGSGLNTVYGHYPIFVDVIADGKVYIGTTEHSPNQPLYRGSEYRCVNATTGAEIWTLTGMGTGMYIGQNDVVADGYFAYLNIYDMQVYCVGKGPSKLTVDAPAAAITQGGSVVIRGSITDIAAGTQQEEQGARFPTGVPCVSDASQQQWMEYIYMQQNKPTAVGVTVNIAVTDSNGNTRSIGTAVSDASGTYSLQWTPDISGKYTVIATFAGTNAYYGSTAETSFAVDPVAPTPTKEAVVATQSIADLYFAPMFAVLLIAVLASIVLTVLVLRKQK
jgi:hypothetical protein